MMDELISPWIDYYKIHSYEVDRQSCLSVVSAINFFQESAWKNAESLGFGFKQLSEKDSFWILSRLYVEIYQYPSWGETIQLETWPKGIERIFAIRDFRLKTADGSKLLGAGTSAWLIIDGTTHRLQRVDHICGHMPCLPQHALNTRLEKVGLPAEMKANAEIIAGFMDIDLNNHVNNVCYLHWAINFFPVKNIALKIHSVELNFLAEAMLHDPIVVMYGKQDDDLFVCSMQYPENKKEYCRCRIKIM